MDTILEHNTITRSDITSDAAMAQSTTGIATRSLKPHNPRAILASPDDVLRLAQSYFYLKANNLDHTTDPPTPRPIPPTPAGLAVHLGFASRTQMMKAIEDTKHPEESRSIIAYALTQIEEYIMENALTDRLNVPMAKFTLSSTLGVIEKKEVNTTEDKTVRYVISTAEPVSKEEEEEISRLEALLQQQEENELMVAGRAEMLSKIDRGNVTEPLHSRVDIGDI